MSNININTDQLLCQATNILELTQEYNMIIDKLFKELTALDEEAWSGSAAKIYTQNALIDKTNYKIFGNNIKIYGETLKQTAELYDNIIKKSDLNSVSKITVDISSVETVIPLLDDVINIYNESIKKLKRTYLPYSFEKKYLYQHNYDSLKKDMNDLKQIRNFVNDSISDLKEIDRVLTSQAKNMPLNPVKGKDFSI